MTEEEIYGLKHWNESAEKAMNDLLDAHEALDRDKLSQALRGIYILVGRKPKNESSGD